MKLPIKFVPCGHFSSFHEGADGQRVDMEAINSALARAERMEEALRFYADRANYQRSAHCVRSNINHDAGTIARAALADDGPDKDE